MATNFFTRLLARFTPTRPHAHTRLAVRPIDDPRDLLISSGRSPTTEGVRDRYRYDRREVLADALEAWRVNPLARRIVSLTTQYVVGGGVTIEASQPDTDRFLKKWWNHRLNRMPVRIYEWCDELTRSGELFIALTTDASGMSYVRAIPAYFIQDIQTAENDAEQPLRFVEVPTLNENEQRTWQAYNPDDDHPLPGGEGRGEGAFPAVMVHYAINRPAGAKFGESDLAPLLRWLSRYASWLEDRVRLNHYRNVFMFVVKGVFASVGEKESRQAQLNANPPPPGSILVTDQSEEWTALQPKLESQEANEDGLAIKKMLAAGSGNPLHFLAEPESSTRTTAEAAGGPTYRHYQQRQIYFLWLLGDLARVVVTRRRMVDGEISSRAEIKVTGADLSAKDNKELSQAAKSIAEVMLSMFDKGLVDEEEVLRLVYTFAGETPDVQDLLKRVTQPRTTPTPPNTQTPNGNGAGPKGEAMSSDRALLERWARLEQALHTRNSQPPDVNLDLHFPEHFARVNVQQQPVVVNVPEQKPPDVAIQVASEPPQVVVNVPQAEAPEIVVNVPPPQVVIGPAPKVDVNVTNEVRIPTVTETFVVERDEEGRAQKIQKTVEQEGD